MTDNPEPWTEQGADGPETIARLLGDPAVWAQPSADVGDRILAAIAAERAAGTDRPPEVIDERWPPPSDRRAASGGPAVPSVTGQLPSPTDGPPPVTDFEQASARRAAVPGSAATPSSTPPVGPAAGEGWGEPPKGPGRTRAAGRRWLPLAAAAAVAVLALATLAAIDLGSSDAPETQIVALTPTELAPDGTVVAEVSERPNGVRIVLDLSGLPPAPEGFFYQAWLVRPEPRNAVSAGTWHLRGGDGNIELWAGVSTEEYTTMTVTLSPESDPTSPGDRLFAGQL